MKYVAVFVCTILTVVGASLAEETESKSAATPDKLIDRSDDAKSGSRAKRLRAMKDIAESVTVEIVSAEGKTKVELVEDARFRFATPEIGCFDGTAWLWGSRRRPLALLTISAYQSLKDGSCEWSYELTSLAPAKLQVKSSEGWQWNPDAAGLDFQPLPDVTPPAETSARRLRQIKDLSRRFDAFGVYGNGRSELRCLPTPIYRYSDEAAGVRDGAMFFLAGGMNPEALLAIELSGEKPAEPVWKFAVNRVSGSELHARFDGKEIWSCHWEPNLTIRSPYHLIVRPMPRELADKRGNYRHP
ncbi:MAG TPA: hypothetical protein VMV10_05105 [Pirellulales bacterium]|nr:hypothetical protein [Pirellulales bacterium]